MSVLKNIRIGLLSSTILLNVKPMVASAAVVQSPLIAIQNAMSGVNNAVTLQYKTNLSLPTWQTLGTFSGSTNLSFANPPAVFIRGVCTNPTVSVTLTWPASADPSVTGYKVYYGVASGTYTNALNVGPATTATVSNLSAGTRYYFAATAYNSSGVESLYSIETNAAFQAQFSLGIAGIHQMGGATQMTVTQAAANAVAIPLPLVITKTVTATIGNPITLQFATNLLSPTWQPLGTFSGSTNLSFTNLPAVFIRGVCTNLTASAALAWQPSSDPTVMGYQLYYGTASRTYTGTVNVGPATTATVSNLTNGTTYYFAVTAYNSSGVQSPFSNEASGAFQADFSLAIGNL
jgi:hypothetical protein